MAKTDTPKKPRWYRNVYDAFKFVRANDRLFLPVFLALVVVFIAGGVVMGFVQGSVAGHISSNLIGISLAALAGIILLSARMEKAAFTRYESMFGGSLPAVQTIRRNWVFEDDPIEIDTKGRAVVFQGVGRGGIVLIGEGDGTTRKLMASARQRLQRIVPGIAIHEVYAGKGPGQVPVPKLTKTVKKFKKALGKSEREAVQARLKALGGSRLPIPKGVDPTRARPSRKALRGR